ARSSRSLPHPHERPLPSPQRHHGRLRRFPRLPEKQTRIHPPYLPAASIIDDVKLPPSMRLQQALTLSPFLITLFGVAALNGTIVSNAAGKCAGSLVALPCVAPSWRGWEKVARAGGTPILMVGRLLWTRRARAVEPMERRRCLRRKSLHSPAIAGRPRP